MKKRIIIIGPPGCGKGTQAYEICKKFQIKHISTGEMLRKEFADAKNVPENERNPEQHELITLMEHGKYVADEIMVNFLRTRLTDDYVLDGFPRTIEQLKMLDVDADYVIHIDVDYKTCMERILNRNEGRSDDKPDVVKDRMVLYFEKTKPVVELYRARGNVVEINGNKTRKEITEDIFEALKFEN